MYIIKLRYFSLRPFWNSKQLKGLRPHRKDRKALDELVIL